ncbi:MAG: pyridoxamine 5'-phosphate oxidase [Bacteroidota bacterium]
MNIDDVRKQRFDIATMPVDPFKQFSIWFEDVRIANIPYSNAMAIATASSQGRPSARMVLLKEFDHNGFVFYTNYESRKASELEANPYGSILFFWDALERQVRIEGIVHRTTREESRQYFATRPRESQIGTWVSRQSSNLPDCCDLEDSAAALEKKFSGQEIQCPDFWGGYRLVPESFEFWQERPYRLHDRVLYKKNGGKWIVSRLFP